MSNKPEDNPQNDPEELYYDITNMKSEDSEKLLNDNLNISENSLSPPPTPFLIDILPFRYIQKEFIYRLFIILFFLIIVSANSLYGIFLPIENPNLKGIDDRITLFVNPINKFFNKHILISRFFFTLSSMAIDIIFIYSWIEWAFLFETMILIVTWVCFYSCRGIVQMIFQMGFPKGLLWITPLFPSVTVPFLQTNDFFFSGHVAMPLIAGLHYYKSNKKPQYIFCFWATLLEIGVVLAMKAHYSIDVIVGLLFGHYTFIIVDRFSKNIDSLFIGKEIE